MQNAPGKPRELARILGLWTAVAVTAGSVIGSGVFKKPQAVAQNVEYFYLAAAAWVLVGILSILGALALAELGAMRPSAGGNYTYLKEGFSPLWGFLWGWVEFWILRSGSTAALATIFSESLNEIIKADYPLSEWDQKWVTIGIIAFLTVVNAVGVRWGGLVQNLTTWLKVGSLLAIAVLPFAMGHVHTEFLSQPGPVPEGGRNPIFGFGLAVFAVMWAYHGWMNLGPLGEEVRDPARNVPRALMIGVGIVIFVYLAANLAYAVVLPQSVMADGKQVEVVAVSFVEAVFRDVSPTAVSIAGTMISVAIMVSVFGALNSQILVGPRTYFAMGRDRMFPAFMGQVHATFQTPVLAIVLQGTWACMLVLGSRFLKESPTASPFDTLTNYVMFAATIFETMAIAAIFRYRRLYPNWQRPYRCWGYPYVPAIYVTVLAGVVANTVYNEWKKSLIGFGFIGAGAIVYFLFFRNLARPLTLSPDSPDSVPPATNSQ